MPHNKGTPDRYVHETPNGDSGGDGLTEPVETQELHVLVPEEYDFIDLGYTGDDLTSVVYKQGGAGGATVATLTLTYAGGNLDTITRT